MVEFCDKCKSSLPFADLIIYKGDVSMSKGYICPYCGQRAAGENDTETAEIEGIVISGGKVIRTTS